MDNKIRTSLVAAAVSAAVANTAFAATSNEHSKALPRFDINHQLEQKAIANRKTSFAGNVLRQGQTTKGQAKVLRSKVDQFDEFLGVNTFSWSKEEPTGVAYNVLNRKAAITESVKRYATINGAKHGVTPRTFSQAKLRNIHDLGRGAIVSRYQQRYNGLEVHGRLFNVVMNQSMELVATAGYFSKEPSVKTSVADDFELSATKAITAAFQNMGGDKLSLLPSGTKGDYEQFEAQGSDKYHFIENPRAKKIYYPVGKKLVPAYFIELMASEYGSTEHMGYSYVISAKDGQLLNRLSLVDYDAFTYNVYASPEAPYRPYDGPIGNDLSPHPTGIYNDPITEMAADMNHITIENVGISTDDPWLPADATITSGNNVFAYADLYQPDGYDEPTVDAEGNPLPGDMTAEVTSGNTFDYPYDPAGNPRSEANIKSAIVNLFYVNNYMHNIYYDHGFTEETGNAQVDNYGRGGLGEDPIHAEAQDHSGFNNANMLTGDDGIPPRMQMYLFSGTESNMTLSGLDDFIYEVSGSVGTGVADGFVGDVVEMLDGTDTLTDGCEAATNADELMGKVALVDRGSCSFVQKALNAQAAGATAIIVANNTVDAPDDVFNMGGSDPTLVIPAVMISYNSGVNLREVMRNQTVTMTLDVSQIFRDGTLDNSIVEHEWAHYFTRRLGNGIYATNQGGGMGEGWSDFMALLTIINEQDQMLPGNHNWQGVYNAGGYAVNLGDPTGEQGAYYFGIRRVPYTVNHLKNFLTFRHIENGTPLPTHHPISGDTSGANNSAVHNTGEVWATSMLEAYVSLLNHEEYSFEEARSRLRDYIVAGLQITPYAPTFTEARDGVLAAALAHSPTDYHLMREAFTKRGMGVAAVAPLRSDQENSGVVEDFDSVLNALEFEMIEINNQHSGTMGAYCDTDGVLDAGETSSIMVKVKNIGVHAIEGAKIQISTDADVTFSNDGMIELSTMENWTDTAMGMVEMTLNSADVADIITVNISVISDDQSLQFSNQSMTMEVNRDIAKDPTRTYEHFQHEASVWNDWTKEKIGPDESGAYDFLHDWTVFRPDQQDFGIGHYIWGPNGVVETDVNLISPALQVAETGDFVTEMIHFYRFEAGNWDGGVIEVSIDGGEWIDAVAAGGRFTVGGYNGVVDSYNQILGGREAFVSEIPTGYGYEALVFPEGTLNGHEVKLRFRIGTDAAAGELGWILDDIAFSNITNLEGLFSSPVTDSGVCVNRPPSVHVADMSVEEITDGSQSTVTLMADYVDHDGNDLTYAWTQTGGDEVTLSDATAANPTFTVPVIGEDMEYSFSVTVSDGAEMATGSFTVHVANTNVAPTISGGTSVTVQESGSVDLTVTGSDVDGDEISYEWKVNGASSNVTTNTYHYEAPAVTTDTNVTITVTATDGEAMSNTETFTVTVENKKSSGGTTGLWTLLLAPLALLRRRKVQK